MHPELFEIPFIHLTVKSYGTMMVVAFLVALISYGNVGTILKSGTTLLTPLGSRPFHYLFKNALEHSSVMIYDGHSGLGAHLDIPSIEEMEGFKIERNPKDYQIFFLNSCSSYSYYNLSYHQLKERRHPTKYLDVLANGLETAFDETQTSNLALIRAIDQWATRGKKQTYQSLAKTMEADNLFFVSGSVVDVAATKSVSFNRVKLCVNL